MSLIKYATYRERANRLATVDNTPTMTDQAGSEDTDINVIVKRYGVYGTMPQGTKQARFGEDYSQLPDDLAGFIYTARSVERLRGELPFELANLTMEELVTYDTQQLAELLKAKPDTTKETTQ